MTDKEQSKRPVTAEQKAFQIIPDEQGFRMARVYANFALITHGVEDFTVYFCDVQEVGPMNMDLRIQHNVYRAPVVAKVALSAGFVPKLIEALQKNYEKYKDRAKR